MRSEVNSDCPVCATVERELAQGLALEVRFGLRLRLRVMVVDPAVWWDEGLKSILTTAELDGLLPRVRSELLADLERGHRQLHRGVDDLLDGRKDGR
jgi:hypothetical protein